MLKEQKVNDITVEVTNYCNLNCIMCFKRGLPKQTYKHMSLELFKKILDDIKPIGGVCFVGLGEPLLNPDFFYMLLEAKKRGLGINMVTNGTFLNKEWSNALIKMRVNKISISLDAATKDTYDKIRKNGNWDRVLENIRTLVEERKNFGSQSTYIRLDFVGMKNNIHELPEFVDLTKKLGADGITMLHLEPSTKELESQHLCNMPKEEVETYFKDALFKSWKSNIKLNLRPLEPVCNFCNNAWLNPYIDTDGNVSICCLTGSAKEKNIEYFKDSPIEMDPSKITFGNIYKQNFKDIWNGEKINEYRNEYSKIFISDIKKKWNMENYLKLRKENKNIGNYCLVCARRFSMVC